MSEVRMTVRIGPYVRRDRFAAWLANQALRLASRRYRAMVKSSIALGLKTAAMEPDGSDRDGALATAAREITGDSWLDDLARASLRTASAKFDPGIPGEGRDGQ